MFDSLCFRHTCPGFLLSKFASQIKLIQSVDWGLVASVKVPGFEFHGLGCQGPMSQCRKSQVIRSQFQGPKFYGLESRVLGSWVPGSRVLAPRSSVLVVDYATSSIFYIFFYCFYCCH